MLLRMIVGLLTGRTQPGHSANELCISEIYISQRGSSKNFPPIALGLSELMELRAVLSLVTLCTSNSFAAAT
jgi:hypothetical protein